MIRRLIACLFHRERTERTDAVVHAMRNQTQAAEAERWRFQKARLQEDMTWLEEALTPRSGRKHETTTDPV
jgi:hypothetical protein